MTQRAYVIGAFIPHGGTRMAYHIGKILEEEFGYQAVAVAVGSELAADRVSHRDMPMISISEMERDCRSDDILVCNPSFSHYSFGFRLKLRKISYVQGFSTFAVLDKRFDLYVAVSQGVSRFLRGVYDISAPVVPAFIDLEQTDRRRRPWEDRPPLSVFTWIKGPPSIVGPMSDFVARVVQHLEPKVDLRPPLSGISMTHSDFLEAIAGHRYFLALSPTEGFGLAPLEAMALEACVVGFDGYGGRDYMRPQENCLVRPYAEIELVAMDLVDALKDEEKARRLAASGRRDAQAFGYLQFRAAWIDILQRFLNADRRADRQEPIDAVEA